MPHSVPDCHGQKGNRIATILGTRQGEIDPSKARCTWWLRSGELRLDRLREIRPSGRNLQVKMAGNVPQKLPFAAICCHWFVTRFLVSPAIAPVVRARYPLDHDLAAARFDLAFALNFLVAGRPLRSAGLKGFAAVLRCFTAVTGGLGFGAAGCSL